MIVAEPESAHLLDRGFGALLLFGALMEATKGTPRQWTLLRSLVIFMAVTASVPRINTGISQIGIAFLICYFLALNTALANSKTRLLQLFPVTIILAGASSFRPTFAIYGGGVLIIYVLQSIFKNQGSCLKENIFLLLKVGLVTIAFLSPLMFLSWQSSGTPMFPFFKGNMAEEFIYMESGKGIWGDFIIVLNFMVMPEVLVMTIGMAVVFWAKPNDRTLGFSVIITTLIVVFLVSLNAAYTTGSWMMDLYRYAYPLYAIAFYWILAKCLENASKEKFSSSPSAILAGVMVAIFWSVHLVPASKEIQMELEFLLIQSTGFKFPTDSLRPFYDDLQNKVPPGEKIFAVVDAPYLLNYERNPISNVDVVAYASPTPGMPFHQGPEALRSYLLGLGYKYLLAVDFNKAVFLYNRKAMENHPRPEHRNHAKRYVLDFLNNVDALSEKSTIAKNDNARLISL
jgi:hypothetical protein